MTDDTKTPENEELEPQEGAETAAEADTEPTPEEQVADMRDKLMRALADAENTRRRAERDKEDAYKYANTRFARDLLPVVDNFRRALESIDSEAKEAGGQAFQNLLDGIAITERELLGVFEKHGVKQIAPAEGDKFDPNVHQAMAEVPGTHIPNGHIFQVTQTGYMIEDRLLRPAMVLVAKGDPVPKAE